MSTSAASGTTAPQSVREVDAVVVGAGFGGLYMVHRLQEMGLTVQAYEAAPDVGGTWYWNHYPGARTDCEGYYYCYSFDPQMLQEWTWKERYPTQPEMQSYFGYVADKFDLRRHYRFATRVETAEFDEASGRWQVRTDTGERTSATYLVTAVGILSAPNLPDFPGIESFEGQWLHTAYWPAEGVDLAGKRVGIIGTGSTGVQAIPLLAEQAEHLTVFQRTPNYVIPARNRAVSQQEMDEIKTRYDEVWAKVRRHWFSFPFENANLLAGSTDEQERTRVYEKAWEYGGFPFLFSFDDLLFDTAANDSAAEFVRDKIRAAVTDPAVAEKLTPRYPFGAKRPPSGSGYYETFNREDVDLIDVSGNAIAEITAHGVRLADGTEHEVDVLVFATGFDASTGALTRMNIVGRDGETLAGKWAPGPRTHLGIGTHGFPNMFMITGPQSPFTNIPPCAQNTADWIADAITHINATGGALMEATEQAQDAWTEQITAIAEQTLLVAGKDVHSWFTGTNVEGKAPVINVFFGGADKYMDICEQEAADGYSGFEIHTPAVATR
ncbi:flavin-containing monooxygenase [Rhodococcus sp. WAY2]|uniref:flavin-containing monooxygenase n=1 Tax=Rhodococcus sp. WAY2 TaxID=2663121 RepID=UPI0013204B53|nr:NAD(P)/FAD-dependent oxidoreductase [Rhodococcus sp. WAY2]QHE73226.1 Cyclohexanone monooxygenase [Rhodococcus sp. WAY2]